jgi:hypothetical protein
MSKANAIGLSENFTVILSIFKEAILSFISLTNKNKIDPSVLFWSFEVAYKCSLSEEEAKPIGTGY